MPWRVIKSIGRYLRVLTGRVETTSISSVSSSSPTSGSPNRQPVPSQRGPVLVPERNVGPRMLVLFDQLHTAYQAEQDAKRRIQTSQNSLRTTQLQIDSASFDIVRLQSEGRVDCTEYIDTLQRNCAAAGLRQIASQQSLVEAKATQKQRNDELNTLWRQIVKISQAYFDKCLDADFQAPWCISSIDGCSAMRSVTRTHRLIEQSTMQVRQLIYRRACRNIDRWKAQKAVNALAPGSERMETEQARVAKLSNDVAAVDAELKPAQDVLDLRLKMWEEHQDLLIQNCIIPLLVTAGVIADDDQRSAQSVDGHRSQDMATSQGSGDSHAGSRASSGGSSQAELIVRYEQARDNLETLQRDFGAKQLLLRAKDSEAEYFLTFTNASPSRYSEYVARQLQAESESLVHAEEEFRTARDELLSAGGTIPSTPPPTTLNLDRNRNPIGSRSSNTTWRSTDTTRVRRMNRRPVNEYRFSQRPVRPASISTGARSGNVNLGSPGSRSANTTAMTPSPGRDQTLRDYRRMQEDYRLQEEQRRAMNQ